MAKKTKKPWQGRFSKKTHQFVEGFTSSIELDNRLATYDIWGTEAHAKMLEKVGILTNSELRKVLSALKKVENKIYSGKMKWDHSLEDIHMHIEKELIDMIGDTAKKIHTGRSRNDQVATDMRLYVRDEIIDVVDSIIILQKKIIKLAEKYSDSIMPGFTHLQVAQPVTFGFVLMSWFFMLERDKERFVYSFGRVNTCPLGSGALSGSSHKLDRKYVAKLLDFEGITDNALDSVSDRDFIIDFISNSSILMSHLSRFSEEIIIWCSTIYNFIELDDEVCTGSSIMPQKKNPDSMELVRAKASIIIGNLSSIQNVMKSLPLTYSKDLQEDKSLLRNSSTNLKLSIDCMIDVVKSLKTNKKNMENAVKSGFSNATDLADWLVKNINYSFRKAHGLASKIVNFAETKGVKLHELSLLEYQEFDKNINKSVYNAIKLPFSVDNKKSFGGTSRSEVKKMIKIAKKEVLK